MAIDCVTPHSRRALLMGALGAIAASAATFGRPATVRAGTDGDVALDASNAASGTTDVLSSAQAPVLRVVTAGDVGIIGSSGVDLADIPDPIKTSTGIYGLSVAGHGVYGASDTGVGVYAANNASTVAAIVAEGGPGTAIHGHANAGPVPSSPSQTAIFASAAGGAHGIQSWVETGYALQALSTQAIAILASGDADGIAGASSGAKTGVVGWSTDQDPPAVAPAGPAKTGVYGEATLDAGARGVFGKSTAGQGVRGEATTGVGVKAVATTGAALDVSGRALFSRSGRAFVPRNATSIDVAVPGGLPGSPNVLATLQTRRGKVHVTAARPNYPSAGMVRIYLSDVASTTAATPVAWFVLG